MAGGAFCRLGGIVQAQEPPPERGRRVIHVILHMYHTLALFGVGLLALYYPTQSAVRLSGYLFLAGIVIFSGSLYVLSLTGIRWLGAITPIGGVAFLAGWALLAWTMLRIPA